MTVTLGAPQSPQVGPGAPVLVTWDFIGPHTPGTHIQYFMTETATGRELAYFEAAFMTNFYANRLGFPNGFTTQHTPPNGAAIGAAVTIVVEVHNAAHGVLDSVTVTTKTWDPVSYLWIVMNEYTNGGLGLSSADRAKIDSILAAVKHTYSTP